MKLQLEAILLQRSYICHIIILQCDYDWIIYQQAADAEMQLLIADQLIKALLQCSAWTTARLHEDKDWDVLFSLKLITVIFHRGGLVLIWSVLGVNFRFEGQRHKLGGTNLCVKSCVHLSTTMGGYAQVDWWPWPLWIFLELQQTHSYRYKPD